MRLLDSSDRQWLMKFENQLLFELYVAYLEARRGGKRGTFDEHKFEANDFENLINLRDSMLDKTYRPSRGTAHIIHNPVIREIFAASFRDRVIHHWMYDIVYDWDEVTSTIPKEPVVEEEQATFSESQAKDLTLERRTSGIKRIQEILQKAKNFILGKFTKEKGDTDNDKSIGDK